MTATVFYDNVNEIALLASTFLNASGTAADPSTVSCVVTDPSGTATTHTYAGAFPSDIAKPFAGKYTLSVPCSPALAGIDGLWSYVWIGTGSVSDVQPGTWRVLPTNLQAWYIGLDEFKDRLGITDTADDSQAQIAIQSVCQWINEYCGRHFSRITEVRTFQPGNVWLLDIDDLVSVTALALDMDGDGVYELHLTQNVDYQLRIGEGQYNANATGIARPYTQVQIIQTGNWLPFTWPYTRLDRVQITGTWGWPAVPPPVTEAAFILAADIFKMKDAPFGVAGVSDLGVTRIQSNPWLVEMLRAYVRMRRKVGV
jgi:gp6-like head-tail connector protein